MARTKKPELRFPIKLTQAQRKIVAEIAPEIADQLKLDEKLQRTIQVTIAELATINEKAARAIQHASGGMVRNSLRHVVDLTAQALEDSRGVGAVPAAERVYQFKITLVESHPAIWRRIHVKNCTLDRLHEHIQTAMGWTNSHLHNFKINGSEYGDPELLNDELELNTFEDSTSTKVSDILPKSGKRFTFEYEYDFGDCWKHEVLFEGCVRAEVGGRYPVCLEGARSCPPEDVGGMPGYVEYQEAMTDPDHERHDEFTGWRGPFAPEAFDAVTTTKRMRRGLPDWRSEQWI